MAANRRRHRKNHRQRVSAVLRERIQTVGGLAKGRTCNPAGGSRCTRERRAEHGRLFGCGAPASFGRLGRGSPGLRRHHGTGDVDATRDRPRHRGRKRILRDRGRHQKGDAAPHANSARHSATTAGPRNTASTGSTPSSRPWPSRIRAPASAAAPPSAKARWWNGRAAPPPGAWPSSSRRSRRSRSNSVSSRIGLSIQPSPSTAWPSLAATEAISLAIKSNLPAF